jgi:hypothetical protein
MNEPQTCLTTKDAAERRVPPIVPALLWHYLRLTMWCWAIGGTLFFVGAVASYFVDLKDLFLIPGRDTLLFGGVLGSVGVSFVWLRMRGYIKFCGE